MNYNERKVQKGKAMYIHAPGFLKSKEDINFYDKLTNFHNLNKRNEKAATKTLHIPLNFDPSEKLTNSKLQQIAELYIDKFGFGEQPFLVYKHED